MWLKWYQILVKPKFLAFLVLAARLERWDEGEQISLASELPAIHAHNRAERERAGIHNGEEVKDENS